MQKVLILVIFMCIVVDATAQTVDLKIETKSIEQLRDDWGSYLQNKQLEKSIDLYAEDAVFFNPDGSKAVGKKEIAKLYHQVMQKFDSHIQFSSTGVHISDTVGYDNGDYNEELIDNTTHKKMQIKGSYLMVLQKQNAVWKITRLMWTQ